MNKQFEVLKRSRELVLKRIEGLTTEQLHTIPEGFNNNIAWNAKKINDFINQYCDGFEYIYNDVFFVSIEDFTLTEQINLLLERLLNM